MSARTDHGRREFLRRTGVAAGTVVTLASGSQVAPRFSPVGRAQAVAPIVIYGGVAAGSAAVGWALGEWDPLESNSPPDGMTPDTLHTEVWQTARTRYSTAQSTFVDNRNIVESGLPHTLYGDGKVAGIEALNDQKSESEVTADSRAAIEPHATTVQKNFLRSWNEAVSELKANLTAVENHADLNSGNVFSIYDGNDGNYPDSPDRTGSLSADQFIGTQDVTLADGSTFGVETIDGYGVEWNPTKIDGYYQGHTDAWVGVHPADTSADDVNYLHAQGWKSIWDLIGTTVQDVDVGLQTWVSNVYGQVQAGELDTADLLTPRELAEMSAAEEGVNNAIADLMALNVPVDLEREATITVQTDSGPATISGMIAPTDPPDAGIVSGETYIPSNMTGDIYFNYDISQGSAVWSAYETAVDGGTVTFTSEPYDSTNYRINTGAGESAVVVDDDFTEDTTNGVWTVDISDQVDTAITEVDSVEMTDESGETRYELIQLQNEFTVDKIENSDGEEQNSMTFEQNDPQDDTNYITQEEWDAMQERNQELIDKYEESQNPDNPLGGIINQDWGSLGPTVAMFGVGLLAIVAAVGAIVSKANPLNWVE